MFPLKSLLSCQAYNLVLQPVSHDVYFLLAFQQVSYYVTSLCHVIFLCLHWGKVNPHDRSPNKPLKFRCCCATRRVHMCCQAAKGTSYLLNCFGLCSDLFICLCFTVSHSLTSKKTYERERIIVIKYLIISGQWKKEMVCVCTRASERERHKCVYLYGVMQTIICLLVSAPENQNHWLHFGFLKSNWEICMSIDRYRIPHIVYI